MSNREQRMRQAELRSATRAARSSRFGMALLLLLQGAGTAVTAADSVLRKCIAADGSASYQNVTCPSDSEAAWEREFDPVVEADPPPPRPAVRMPGGRDVSGGNRSRSGASSAAASTLAGRLATCDAARRKRKSILDAVGLARTYDLLSRLDREVWAACKGLGP
jgi:hypothetical protein